MRLPCENEYIGYSTPTFVSGGGLDWVTYAKDLKDEFEEQFMRHVGLHCMTVWNIEDLDELYEDERWDLSDLPVIVWVLTDPLLADALRLSTADAWKQFEGDIRAEQQAARQAAARHQAMWEEVEQFWELYFQDLMGVRIGMPLFRALGLAERIADVLADADPAIVEMMAEVGVLGSYSNKVSEHIRNIVRRATK